MSLAINIYKKQRNILLVLVNKKKVMELWSLLALKSYFPLFWRSWENSLLLTHTHTRTHTQADVLNSRRGHNEETTSLKYYMQDITVNNYLFISLKIIMLVFIT